MGDLGSKNLRQYAIYPSQGSRKFWSYKLSHSKACATDHVMKSGILIGRNETWEKVDVD